MGCTCYDGPDAPQCNVHTTPRDQCQRALFEAAQERPDALETPEGRFALVDAVLTTARRIEAEMKDR